MARIHGRNGALYAAITSSGTAEPIAFMKTWSASFKSNRVDVTAFGDPTAIYVSGLPDSSGAFDGWFDDATPQLYTAAIDGQPRKAYFYPSRLTPTVYWYNTALFDLDINVGVADGVSVSGTWAAASATTKIG